ncbi:MAG: hypothetical protein AMXMBFR48_23880 [Ignavibacteriales bacterium]
MKAEPKIKTQIQQQFEGMRDKKDLLNLLTAARNQLYGKTCEPFELKVLTYYANPEICRKRYRTFSITKKSGGKRTINTPVKGLNSLLKALNFVLQEISVPHKAAFGFVTSKSIVDNAKLHVGRKYVYNIDLSDFFHSFDRNQVKLAFMYEPFNLHGEREPLAFLLACLCTHPLEINSEIKTVLPQGSPTSPTLTNILCKKLDRRLTGLANRFGLTYSRYADDITFSADYNVFNKEDFLTELRRIIEQDQKLVVNPRKTRLQNNSYRQEATGLIVNEKVNVRRRYVKQLRMWLSYWEKYGYHNARKIFLRDYKKNKGHLMEKTPKFSEALRGKLEFLRMVRGDGDILYRKLKRRFERLEKLNATTSSLGAISELELVIEKILNKGVLEGIDFYSNIKRLSHDG